MPKVRNSEAPFSRRGNRRTAVHLDAPAALNFLGQKGVSEEPPDETRSHQAGEQDRN
jgi:hypothetical protein